LEKESGRKKKDGIKGGWRGDWQGVRGRNEEQEVAGRWNKIEEDARKGREFEKEWEERKKESTGRKYGGD
jgi:hypothetical protein